MKSKASSLIKSIREGFQGDGEYSLIELNAGRIGLPYVGSDRLEVPMTMVVASDQGCFTYAQRNPEGITVTTISENPQENCSYLFKSEEIDLLYQFNLSSTEEMNTLNAESQYPVELSGMSNIVMFSESLHKNFNVNVHSPALTLTPAKNAWDSNLRVAGSAVIAVGDYKFGLNEEKRGAIFKVLDENRMETIYNPDLGESFNNIRFDSSAFNNLFESGVKFYSISPKELKKLSTNVAPDSKDTKSESFIDPVKYRATLSRIHGDKAIKNSIMEAIDFSQEFSNICEKKKLSYYEDYKQTSSSKNFRDMISNLTQLDFDINEVISKYESYTRKVNEGRDEYILSIEKKSLDSCVKSLFNLVSDLKSTAKTF